MEHNNLDRPLAVAALLVVGFLAGSLAVVPARGQVPAAAEAAAPSFSARVSGTVAVDGLAVPGVTVTLTDPASGQKYVTSTDERGGFVATVGHPGEFDISAEMAAFAVAHAKVVVPAVAGTPVPPVAIAMVLSSTAPASPAPSAPTATASRGAAPARAGGAPGAAASQPNPNPRMAVRTAGRGAAGGRGGRGGQNASADNSFQALDISQTGAVTDTGNDASLAANSGVAGMTDTTATDSTVITGQASQDDRPMDANAIAGFLRDSGLGGGPGGPGGPDGPGGAAAPGGGGPGGGGRGGFGGGGRGGFAGGGGFGGRGGFNFRQFSNRFNQPHGNLSYTLSDSALNALPHSLTGTTATAPPNAANQRYSATVTTPFKIPHIYDDKGKTNITLSFSGTHDASLSNVTALVPTLNERSGNFQGVTDAQGHPVVIKDSSGNPVPGNSITPTAAATGLLAYIPLPTPGSSGRFNYSNTLDALNTNHNLSLRVNHSFGSSSAGGRGGGRGGFGRGKSLNFNLNYSGGNAERPGTFFPYEEGFTKTRGINAGLGYTQPMKGWINMLRINYNRNRTDLTNLYANSTNVAGALGITGVSTNPTDWGLPSLTFSTSGLTGLSDTHPNYVRSSTWSVSDTMIRRMGKHNFRLGGDFRWLQNNPETDQSPNGAFSFDGQYSGYDFADFLLGMPQQTSERYGGGVFYFRQIEPDLFFNDNWQASGSFTLTYGLRWEYISPYTEKYNRLTNLLVAPDFSSVTPVLAGQGGVSDSVIKPEYGHVRPDLGFAWKSWANMIVRGGFGMAYNTGAYANMATALAYQSPFIVTQTNLGTATTPLSLTNGFAGSSGVTNTYGVNPDYTVGYSYLWNLDVQRQVGRAYVIQIDYSGSRGEHLDQLRAPNRTTTGLLYPNVPVFLYDTTGGNSMYNGGSLTVSRRMSQSVSFRASYTYSKMMDDASQIGGGGGANGSIAQNDQNLNAEWALSSGNVTNNFNASYEWQLPYGLNHHWGDSSSALSSALGDWQVSGSFTARSGSPFTPTVSNIYSNAQGLQALGVNVPLRANVVAGQTAALANPTLTNYFNTAAFVAPAAGSYGNAGRDTIIGPGQIALNMSLSKTFRMGEFRSMEIRFDSTNALNHPNWQGLETNLNSSTFGSVAGFGSPRQITFSARFRY